MEADRPSVEPFRLLFVCTGNTCRSPLAEAIARRELSARGWGQLEVRSAGVGAAPGGSASQGSLEAARRHGLDLSSHRSAPVDADALEWADLILVMSPSHLVRVSEMGAGEKATLLGTFAAGEDPEGIPDVVPDPFGGSDEEYEATFVLLERLVGRVLDRLAPILAP
jgi:protein-tyrosine phosphatase